MKTKNILTLTKYLKHQTTHIFDTICVCKYI